jgi:ABC-type Zn uptake system ZnuABC Zn-binding protein ZnuA
VVTAIGLITAALERLAPDQADAIARHGTAYATEVAATDASDEALLASVPDQRRKLVTNHDALGYFADRYGFEIVATVVPGGSTLAEPSSAELTKLVELLRTEDVTTIFAETTASATLAEAVASELGTDVKVVTLATDSLGDPGSSQGTYLGMIRSNAEKVAGALE